MRTTPEINEFVGFEQIVLNCWSYLMEQVEGGHIGNIRDEALFTSKNLCYPSLVEFCADTIKTAKGAKMYSVLQWISDLEELFDEISRCNRGFFITKTGDYPKVTGRRFVEILRMDIDKYWAEKIAKSQQGETATEDATVTAIAIEQADVGRKVERTLRPKFGLRALNFAVIDGDNDRRDKLSKALCEGMGMREDTALEVIPNVRICASSQSTALGAIDFYTDSDRDPHPPIDIIFIGSRIGQIRDGKPSYIYTKALMNRLDCLKADPKYAKYLRGVKIVVLQESPDAYDYAYDFVLGHMDMSEGNGISLATRLIGFLANKGIVEPDLKNADAQLKLHTDNFNREAKTIIANYDATNQPGKDFWANGPMLRELLELINKYRAAEGLSAVELHTEGPHQYVFIVSALHVAKYVKPELLLKAPEPTDGVKET